MKKTLFTILISLTLVSVSFAQNGAYEKGDNLVNVGIGLTSYYAGGGIPLCLAYEKGITDDISVGGGLDFLSRVYPDYGYGPLSFTAFYIGARGAYHFNNLLKKINMSIPKLDVYGGVGLGYEILTYSDNIVLYRDHYYGGYIGYPYYGYGYGYSYLNYGSGLFFGLYAGGKYYFTPKFCGLLELGATGSTNVRIGVGLKLK